MQCCKQTFWSCTFFLLCLKLICTNSHCPVHQHYIYITWELDACITMIEIILATHLTFRQPELQALCLAYFKSLVLFSITQLCIYMYIFFSLSCKSKVQHQLNSSKEGKGLGKFVFKKQVLKIKLLSYSQEEIKANK